MFVQSSCSISPAVSLATLGSTCRYLVRGSKRTVLVDIGHPSESPRLKQRFERMKVAVGTIDLVFVTELDRLAAYKDLFTHNPPIALSSSQYSAWQLNSSLLKLPCESHPSNEHTDLGDGVQIHRLPILESAPNSQAFLVTPDNVIIADTSFGFFRGAELPAPTTLKADALARLTALLERPIGALALPWQGALTGERAKEHLRLLIQTCSDLREEYAHMTNGGASPEELFADLKQQLYQIPNADESLQAALNQAALQVWDELTSSK